ncbi:ABC transporter ATP-binding protein [Arenibacterium halophilum]|uniref:ABC transporter ATP-binding protein n=1 Tax=Arenibacterium halophilum TaxID=2583821 RepID=A0ABY2XD92_9RHOB|nr:ABC transporter ATP-binding protein [Arenibacterium halophilum]TMV14989.1 ABC transporter ATP-binding protein [Arenibacterium halophilum]
MRSDLSVRNLVVNYGPVRALHGVSFDVPEGQIAALVGSNGAGKSTVLKSICGLLKPVEGEIRVGEEVMKPRPGDPLRHGVALSPEGRRLFGRLSVEENLMMGAYTVKDAAARDDMLDRVYGYFPRLKERRRQMAGSLSGGEQQMCAIGRALMAQPRVLLLDEPSLGIAPIIVAELAKIIEEISRDTSMTVLLVEQNAQMALSIAATGVVLETGNVVLTGTGRELLASPEVRAAYLGT